MGESKPDLSVSKLWPLAGYSKQGNETSGSRKVRNFFDRSAKLQ